MTKTKAVHQPGDMKKNIKHFFLRLTFHSMFDPHVKTRIKDVSQNLWQKYASTLHIIGIRCNSLVVIDFISSPRLS